MAYIPEFKGAIEGYVVNHMTKNYWRVERTHTREEVLQEAYVVFLRLVSKYPMVEEPQHFMALFKTSWANEFTDLSLAATEARRLVPEAQFDDETETEYTREVVGDLDNMGALATMVRQAPREVAMVLNLFLNAPTELLELAQAAWRRGGRYRADGDQAVARMLGLPAESRPVSATRDYFEKREV